MRGRLKPYREEAVQLMTETTATGRLGENTVIYTATGVDLSANVQPLGAEHAEAAGLVADRELLRVQISPAVDITPGDHLYCRDREWHVIRAEDWNSYTLVVVEPA